MDDRQTEVRTRLEDASKKRGRMALIAKETGISYQTIYCLMREKHTPNAATIDKLLAYFKKEEKRAKQ